MQSFLKKNGLSVVTFGLFFIFIVGQSIAGLFDYNQDQMTHAGEAVSYLQYLKSGKFIETVFENWESEFLQMGLYVILTSFLFQKGSAESKSLVEENKVDEDPNLSRSKSGVPWPVRRGGWILKFYKHSLSIALLSLFLISFFLHAAGGAAEYREEQAQHGKVVTLSMWQYMGTSRFWFESFQNWQSEFLSIGVLVVLSIYLRQKGSPESKPVATPHEKEEAA
jgi:hypothetical protein